MDSASTSLSMIEPRQRARLVHWRTCLAALCLCFVLSTEVLFSPSMFADWTPGQIFDGWLEQFIDIVCLGFLIMAAVSVSDRLIGEQAPWRLLGLLTAVILAATGGYLGLTSLHYPAGYYPPAPVMIGDALRIIFLGSMATIVWAVQRSNAKAANRLRAFALDRAALKKGMLEAELKALEAQIEPHFLFNTLANVRCLFQSDIGSAEQMLASLRVYLGAALPKFRGEHPTLGSECALVKAYLDILQVRMGRRLIVDIDLPGELAEVAFPPMILMTLVENAIKHGLAPLAEGGRIEVVARANDAMLEIAVRDNGAGIRTGNGGGIGLANIRSRLAALYGDKALLALESNSPHGVLARVVVPHLA
jgi:signal transduction histidine kinase